MNNKYSLNILQSNLNLSNIFSNSWFAGFIEADGQFGVKITNSKNNNKNISIVFRLDQRSHNTITNSSMLPIMKLIAKQLNCKVLVFKYKTLNPNIFKDVLSISLSSPVQLAPIVNYFNDYNLLGNKNKDFRDWEKVYQMILSKKHLTESGKLKIIYIKNNMNSKRQFIRPQV